MHIKGYTHFSFAVKNIERSVEFYRDVLGFTILAIKKNAYEGLGKSLGINQPYADLKIALMKLPKDDIQIELIEYVDPKPAEDYVYNPSNAGACHIAFGVEDIENAVTSLKEKGVIFNSEINAYTTGDFKGWKWVYFQDPDGINLELVEIQK